MHLDSEAVIVDGVARIYPEQLKVLGDRVESPAETAAELFHRHVEDFLGSDDLDSMRHIHQRKHRSMIVVQVGQEYR